ncbi:MAG: septum formation initiator family protein [Marmoricola sp.]|jgi:cell division protein FtsB|nr:septum formation initiator family protein [Marmoricola sp.]MCW2837318.1 septum formation initiator family protein [Marmoricola sp.]
MATRRTPNGPRKGPRPGRIPGNNRPRARGSERARTTAAADPRPRFTNRMAILVVVVAVLVVSYASSMRAYLQQRSHINDLQSQIASSQKDILALEREKRRWADSAYVETQARERFGWVLPGETSYQVIDRNGKPLERTDELTDPASVARQVPDAWWDKVNSTLQAADHPKKAPTPKESITAPPAPTPSPGP